MQLKFWENSPAQNGSVPPMFLQHLTLLEPNAQFEFLPPDVIKSSNDFFYLAKTNTIQKPITLRIHEDRLISLLLREARGLVPESIASGHIAQHGKKPEVETYRRYFLYRRGIFTPLSSNAAELLAIQLVRDVHSCVGMYGFGIYDPFAHSRARKGVRDISWEECYGGLIRDVLSRLDPSKYPILCREGAEIIKRVIPRLLDSKRLKIQPVLIHGNLWANRYVAGDACQDERGVPVACNPAPMFAHNEFDLTISFFLGKLPSLFYETYHRYIAKSDPVEQYDLRQELYLLFYYLNHIATFGERYAHHTAELMNRLLRNIPEKKKVRFVQERRPVAPKTRRSVSVSRGAPPAPVRNKQRSRSVSK